jgi:hypothetical protein
MADLRHFAKLQLQLEEVRQHPDLPRVAKLQQLEEVLDHPDAT